MPCIIASQLKPNRGYPMIKTILTSAVVIITSFSAAQAHEWREPLNNGGYIVDNQTPVTSTVTSVTTTTAPQANTLVESDPAYNEVVNCWGADGTANGQTKKLTRGQCLDLHGTVSLKNVHVYDKAARKR